MLTFALRPQIVLLGDADDIILYLCGELGWELPLPHINTPFSTATENSKVKKRPFTPSHDITPPVRVGNRFVVLPTEWISSRSRLYLPAMSGFLMGLKVENGSRTCKTSFPSHTISPRLRENVLNPSLYHTSLVSQNSKSKSLIEAHIWMRFGLFCHPPMSYTFLNNRKHYFWLMENYWTRPPRGPRNYPSYWAS